MIKRGIVRVYCFPHVEGRYTEKREGVDVTMTFVDFDLDKHRSVRIHIPDFRMEIEIDASGVRINPRDESLLAQE